MDQAIAASNARRRRLDPTERRARIVEAAIRYFAEVGFEGSTRDLATRAGITQPLLYKYFANKAEIVEAVFDEVYLRQLDPRWFRMIKDRSIPLRERLHSFYIEYTRVLFTYEWMRIFMFAGLAHQKLNRRYLDHLGGLFFKPVLKELKEIAPAGTAPILEDLWSLHGSIVYIGIRKCIYALDVPDDPAPAIARSIDRFLATFEA